MNPLLRLVTRFGLGFVLTLAALQLAHSLEPAKGKALLTLKGQIEDTNQGPYSVFDQGMLEALPQHSFTTHTPWDKNAIKFTGPLLRDVLGAVKAKGHTLRAVALNDYRVRIPLDDSHQFDVIVALRMDDKTIPVRTKGPLFIVYPFDSRPELQNSTYFERSIWQLKAIEVE